ncbi:MAG TPA: family 10 glycosylhydrolase, partial [Vicinamibacterales bacterium]
SDEVRALWVTRATLTSPASVTQMVKAAKNGGFNTLIVQVRGRGDAYYRSSLEPRPSELALQPDFDPLADVLTQARPAGIKVHAWINVNLVSSAVTLPSSRQHIVHRQPEWLMVPRELATGLMRVDSRSPEYIGRLARWTRVHATEVEGLYTSAIQPAAAAHIAAVARNIVINYSVDGVHIDYARFPNEDFDYSRWSLQQFKATLRPQLTDADRRRADALETRDPLAYTNLFPERWIAFRQSRLTALVMRIRTAVKAVRPALTISAAVGPELAVATGSRMQDWPTWLAQSLIDVVCPMAYTEDSEAFERQIAAATDHAAERPVWAGIGAYRLDPAATLRHIAAARRQKAAGVILFSYDALITAPNSVGSLAELGRVAFGPASR